MDTSIEFAITQMIGDSKVFLGYNNLVTAEHGDADNPPTKSVIPGDVTNPNAGVKADGYRAQDYIRIG